MFYVFYIPKEGGNSPKIGVHFTETGSAWTASLFKPASKPASTASLLTSPFTPAQTSSQPLKPYLTVYDLYRMFHVKKSPIQTRITSFFKSMIKPMRKGQRNTLPTINNIIKTQVLSSTSPASRSRKTATYQLRKSIDWNFQRYVSDLLLKTAPDKRFENTLHTAPSTLGTSTFTRLNQYDKHIKTWARRRCYLEDLWR